MPNSLSDFLNKTECEYREHQNLARMSYIKVETSARYVVYPESIQKLKDVLRGLHSKPINYVILGRMSNVLFKDRVYNGVVIKTDRIRTSRIKENLIDLECGCALPTIARQLSGCNLGGFEGLLGIPGSIGGMLKQNAGAFGYQISDRCIDCTVYDIKNEKNILIKCENMNFGYRTSILKDRNLVLLSARFEAIEKPENTIREEIDRYLSIRRNTQPITQPSLGSVFKRVGDVSAGYYIDQLNLKGISVGGAQISKKHAGFIVNNSGATASDILKLMDIVKSAVLHEYGITLEEEIEII